MLSDHKYPISSIAWSLDDAVLFVASDHEIKVWNPKVSTLFCTYERCVHGIMQTGICIRTLDSGHEDTVSSLLWLPDGSGVISSGLDRKIIHWVSLFDCLLRIHSFNTAYAECGWDGEGGLGLVANSDNAHGANTGWYEAGGCRH